MSNKYKNGDKVRILEKRFSCNKVGDIGVIKDYRHDNDFRVYVEGRGISGNWHCGDQVELVTEYEAFGHPEDSKVGYTIINPSSKDSDKAMRFNTDKPKVSLIHNESFIPMVKVLEFGSRKYEAHNWKKPMNKIEILESMKRHVDELIDKAVAGESELDSESNEHIIGHIMCNAMFYSYHNVINK